MQKKKDSGLEGYRSEGMQERRDTAYEGCRTGGIQDLWGGG